MIIRQSNDHDDDLKFSTSSLRPGARATRLTFWTLDARPLFALFCPFVRRVSVSLTWKGPRVKGQIHHSRIVYHQSSMRQAFPRSPDDHEPRTLLPMDNQSNSLSPSALSNISPCNSSLHHTHIIPTLYPPSPPLPPTLSSSSPPNQMPTT